MNKDILKTVIVDNQMEVPKYKVIPRDFQSITLRIMAS